MHRTIPKVINIIPQDLSPIFFIQNPPENTKKLLVNHCNDAPNQYSIYPLVAIFTGIIHARENKFVFIRTE